MPMVAWQPKVYHANDTRRRGPGRLPYLRITTRSVCERCDAEPSASIVLEHMGSLPAARQGGFQDCTHNVRVSSAQGTKCFVLWQDSDATFMRDK